MPVNIDKIRAKQEELERAGRKFWQPSAGKNKIRIAPPPPDLDEFYAEGGFHYHVGPDEKAFPCPRLGQERKDCWLCEKVAELDKGDDEEREEASELKAGKKYIIPLLDLDHVELGIQFWLCGFKAFKQICAYFTDDQYGDISDPDAGTNLTVTKSGSGMKTDYMVQADKRESPWPDDAAECLDELPDPWEVLNFPTNAEMEAAYLGSGTKESSSRDSEGDGGSRRAAPARGTTARSRPPRGEAPALPEKAEGEEPDVEEAEPAEAEKATEEPAPRHSERSSRRGAEEPAPRATRGGTESTSRRLGRQLRS